MQKEKQEFVPNSVAMPEKNSSFSKRALTCPPTPRLKETHPDPGCKGEGDNSGMWKRSQLK